VRRPLPATSRDRGATIPIVALLLPVLILMVAFAVDLGMQRSNRRTMQARADIIALDLARLADGRTEAEIYADPSFTLALNGSADRNDVPVSALVWDYGTWTVGSPFNPAGDPPNAVQVTATQEQDYFFQPGSGSVTRTAVAAYGEPVVDLTVGSVGAGFHPTIPDSVGLSATVQALNARLAAQFGATIPNPGSAGFDLVGYRGLAAADVDIWRVAANAGYASPNELASNDITVGQFFDATATALDQQAAEGDPNAANAAVELRRFQTQMGVDNTATMDMGDTFQFAQGGDDAAAAGSMNVLDMLSGSAEAINGDHFATYTLSPGIPGVAIVNVEQYLVSPATMEPNLGVGGTAENKQMRFQLTLQVAPLTGGSSPVTIPLVIEAATAIGTVDRLDCLDPDTISEAEINAFTSGLTVQLGTASNLAAGTLVVTPAVLVDGSVSSPLGNVLLNLGLSALQLLSLNLTADITATGSASILGGSSQHVFLPNQPPVPFQRAPGGLGNIGSQLSSALSVQVGATALSAPATTALRNQLGYVFNNLHASILDPLLAAAGVTIAGADVKAEDLDCAGAGLKLVE